MRSNTLDAAHRSYLSISRGTVLKADDSHKMQTNDVRGLYGEQLTGLERFQQYGISSVPLPMDANTDKGAEAIVASIHGNRSHSVVIAVDDRNSRPKNLKPGDTTFYHHSGAIQKFTDDGFTHDQGTAKKPYAITVGDASATIADGKITFSVDGNLIVLTGSKILFGGEGASIPVMLETGPSSLLLSTK